MRGPCRSRWSARRRPSCRPSLARRHARSSTLSPSDARSTARSPSRRGRAAQSVEDVMRNKSSKRHWRQFPLPACMSSQSRESSLASTASSEGSATVKQVWMCHGGRRHRSGSSGLIRRLQSFIFPSVVRYIAARSRCFRCDVSGFFT